MNDYWDYLAHSAGGWQKKDHKYIDRVKGPSGKWVYIYKNSKPKIKKTSGGFNEGERNRQSWTSYETNKGSELTLVKGSNRDNKYAGITVGKTKDDYEYVEKEKKIGGVTLNYDNENGTHNVTVHIDHTTIEKGKNFVNNLLKGSKKPSSSSNTHSNLSGGRKKQVDTTTKPKKIFKRSTASSSKKVSKGFY